MIKLTFSHLFTLTSLALAGTISNLPPALALTISLDGSPVGGVHNYSIFLEAGESISAGDDLILSNLSNNNDSNQITVTGSSFYTVISSDSTGASLEAINAINGAGSFSPAFSITSTSLLDSGDYLAFFNQGIIPSFSQGSLPLSNTAAVPFEFSPSLGFLVVGGMWAISRLRKRIAAR